MFEESRIPSTLGTDTGTQVEYDLIIKGQSRCEPNQSWNLDLVSWTLFIVSVWNVNHRGGREDKLFVHSLVGLAFEIELNEGTQALWTFKFISDDQWILVPEGTSSYHQHSIRAIIDYFCYGAWADVPIMTAIPSSISLVNIEKCIEAIRNSLATWNRGRDLDSNCNHGCDMLSTICYDFLYNPLLPFLLGLIVIRCNKLQYKP